MYALSWDDSRGATTRRERKMIASPSEPRVEANMLNRWNKTGFTVGRWDTALTAAIRLCFSVHTLLQAFHSAAGMTS